MDVLVMTYDRFGSFGRESIKAEYCTLLHIWIFFFFV